jgi:hypothetical protein
VKEIQLWMVRFNAFAVLTKIVSAIQKQGPDPLLPDTDATALAAGDAGDQQQAAKDKNTKAFAYLTMAMGDVKFVGLLERAKTAEWPNGLAWKVMNLLWTKYMPQDSMS